MTSAPRNRPHSSEIYTIRNRLGLSQSEMAEHLGLHQSTISRFECGEMTPDKRTLIAARALEGFLRVNPSHGEAA